MLIDAGLVATTNHGGAGKWGEEHAQHLEGRNVIVMPDNDQVGHRHADAVVASLWGKANQIKRVDLPACRTRATSWTISGRTRSKSL